MDLNNLINWAGDYDRLRVGQEKNRRNRANTYLGMIVDKGTRILENTRQSDDYMNNIKEYLEQLDKIGVRPQGGEKRAEKDNPLIPN